MTVRFLTGWNGYYEGQIVSGLTNEAKLITAGLASADLDGANNGVVSDVKIRTNTIGDAVQVMDNGTLRAVGGIVPATNDSAGIIAAMAAAVAQKVGVVRLLDTDYTIDQDIQLVSNVALIGIPPKIKYQTGSVPDILNIIGGTRFIVSTGITALKWNNADKAAGLEVNIGDFALSYARVYGIAFIGGKSHIDIGAVYAMGALWSQFEELHSFSSTGFGFNFENFQHITFHNLYQTQYVAGGGIRWASSLDATALIPGNSSITGEIYTYTSLREARSIVFECASPLGSQFNQFHSSARIQANRYGGAPVAILGTFTAASANIGVADATNYSYLQVGATVIFAGAAPTPFVANTIYFVATRPAANTITLADNPSSVVTIPSGVTNTYTMTSNGHAGLEIIGSPNSLFTNCEFGNVEVEAASPVCSIILSRTRQSKMFISELMSSVYPTNICGRDASIQISAALMNNITTDVNGDGVVFMNNARTFGVFTSSLTISGAGGHQNTRVYDSATDGTVTVPTGLIRGFEQIYMQAGAGKLTIAPGAGVTIISRGNLFSTTGPGETLYLRSIGKNKYVLSGVATGRYTVATLPAGIAGMTAYVTDAATPTWNGALTGGGTVVVPVFHNGTAWVSA